MLHDVLSVWTYPRLVGAGFGLCGLLELERGEISQRRVSADAVVKRFEVLKQTLTGCVSSRIPFVMDTLFLQSREETLHRREDADYRGLSFILAIARRTGLASRQFPFRLMEHVTACFLKRVW